MPKLRVASFAVSIDGYGAGPDQSLETPLGIGGSDLHEWFYPTDTFQMMMGKEGTKGTDNDFAIRGFENVGAWILGRNMFSPYRGNWDEEWKGWWGDNPPYHCPTFVLTHHERAPLKMEGGTTFYFTSEPIERVLERAFVAAEGKDVRVGGGVSTINQFVAAGLVDEMHIVKSPTILGTGEKLFDSIDLKTLGYSCTEFRGTDRAVHMVLTK
jgi:dihydrofolate reductase